MKHTNWHFLFQIFDVGSAFSFCESEVEEDGDDENGGICVVVIDEAGVDVNDPQR